MKNDISLTLTIAGSETTGGAGMQADLKTFEEFGCHGMVALTSIVTMSPYNGWAHEVEPIAINVIKKQLETALAGKRVKAMKTGMLPSPAIIELTKKTIEEYKFDSVVIDPVMVCKGEGESINVENADALREMLIPLATVTTPNLFEAGVLSGLGTITTIEGMKESAQKIHTLGAKHVVIKGGKALQNEENAIDVYYDGKNFEILSAPKSDNTYNQGAGCSFAAAITAGLANGMTPLHAVTTAKEYVHAAITNGFEFNKYTGPVYHAAYRIVEGKQIP